MLLPWGMKNTILTSIGLAVLMISSCKKEDDPSNTAPPTVDVTAPVITIAGGNSQSQMAPQVPGSGTWIMPSATAIDNVDGDITVNISVSGNVDPNSVGFDTVYYSVSDAAGNQATDTLVVEITAYTFVHVAPYLAGNYNTVDTCQITSPFTYNSTWTCNNSINDQVTINNFGGFGLSINAICTVNATAQTLSFGTAFSIGGAASVTSSAGSYTHNGNSVQVVLNYTWTDGTSSEACVSHYTK